MVIVLKKGSTPKMMEKIMEKLRSRPVKKGLDADKYCGVVKFKEDGLSLQKRLRDEWD